MPELAAVPHTPLGGWSQPSRWLPRRHRRLPRLWRLRACRQGRYTEAVTLLQRAVQGQPEPTRLAYVYAVALHSMGNALQAITVLQDAHRQRLVSCRLSIAPRC
jgi:tetratricopeptide repeat protein